PFVPGQVRLDAPLYQQRRGSELRARLPGSQIHSAANGCEVAGVPLIDESQIRIILLDIEGTTTPIKFVYQTLFPYASRKLKSFFQEHAQDPEIQSLIQELRGQREADERNGLEPPAWQDHPEEARLRSSVAFCQSLIARDSKCTPLKTLQGIIWQQGFTSGELRGEVYPDVPLAFERWRRHKRMICIYSSGSFLALPERCHPQFRGPYPGLASQAAEVLLTTSPPEPYFAPHSAYSFVIAGAIEKSQTKIPTLLYFSGTT